MTCKELVAEYSDGIKKELEQNNEVVSLNIKSHMLAIEALTEMLKKEEYSFEEKQYIIEQLKYLTDSVDKIDSRNKTFLYAMGGMVAVVVLGSLGAMVTTLGGKASIDANDFLPKA